MRTSFNGSRSEPGAVAYARATVDQAGVGGQTAIFHAATQREDAGIPVIRLLLQRGADLSVRVNVPGHYERPGEILPVGELGFLDKCLAQVLYRPRKSPGLPGHRQCRTESTVGRQRAWPEVR